MTVSVHLFSGFLGAGKTTAIRAQLGTFAGERVAIIVNDFGEAGLDEAALSEDEPFRITNIPGGCVCCTAPEGFVDALGAVLEGQPERLIIEPTGLARPQDLIDTIRGFAGDLIEVDGPRLTAETGEPRSLNIIMLGALARQKLLPFDEATLLKAVERRCPKNYIEGKTLRVRARNRRRRRRLRCRRGQRNARLQRRRRR